MNEAAECIGNDRCPAPVHVHGCYTPHRADQCDAPNEFGHLPPAPVTRPDLDALVTELTESADGIAYLAGEPFGDVMRQSASALAAERARADQAAEESDDWEVKHAQQRRARLAAERICRQLISDGLYWKERADQAEQRVADAPHDTQCASRIRMYFHKPRACDCWKSDTPTAE